MIDEYGRINTKSQAIREFKTEQMAYLLNDININPEKDVLLLFLIILQRLAKMMDTLGVV